MTPWEMRESYLDSILTDSEIKKLKENKLYQRYTYGEIPIDDIYTYLKDQGI